MMKFLMVILTGIMLFAHPIRADQIVNVDDFGQALSRIGQGKTPLQTFRGGQIRLISCRTGVKGLDGLMIGVDVALKNGWQMYAPDLNVSADPWQAQPLPVLRTDRKATEPWTDTYEGRTVFPIWMTGAAGQDANVQIRYNLNLIPPVDEVTHPIPHRYRGILTLSLPATESYPTDTCALLNQGLKSAATDLKTTDIDGWAVLQSNGQVVLRLIFPKKIDYAAVQPADFDAFSVIQSLTEGRLFQAVIRSKSPLKSGDTIPVRIQSSMGCFTWDMPIKNHPLPPYYEPVSVFWGILFGFLFFLFSPLWCRLFMPLVQTQKALKVQARHIQGKTALALLCLGGLWIADVFPIKGVWPLWWALLWLGISLYGLWRPVIRGVWVVPILALWPRPFYEWLGHISSGSKVGVILIWASIAFCAFNLWIIAPKWFLSLKKSATQSYHVLVRLPYLLLILWLGGTLVGYALIENDPVLKDWPQGPAIVRVTDPLCTTCIKERSGVFSKINREVIPLYRADMSSKIISEKYKENQIYNKNFSIFITTDGRRVILPTGISYRTLYDLIDRHF